MLHPLTGNRTEFRRDLSDSDPAGSLEGKRTRGDLGRWVLSGVAVLVATNGFLGDLNRTHLFNPEWTPHSKYHDALTMLLGAGLGAAALRALWREKPDPELSAALSAIFWAAMGVSFAFPGAASIAKEFPNVEDRVGLSKVHEGVISASMLALTAAGYALSRPQAAPALEAAEV